MLGYKHKFFLWKESIVHVILFFKIHKRNRDKRNTLAKYISLISISPMAISQNPISLVSISFKSISLMSISLVSISLMACTRADRFRLAIFSHSPIFSKIVKAYSTWVKKRKLIFKLIVQIENPEGNLFEITRINGFLWNKPM